MNIERALKLTDPDTILKAAKEAETRNCEEWCIRKLYDNWLVASGQKKSKGVKK